jgi:hypothetical protein
MLSKICNAECFDRIIPEAAGSALISALISNVIFSLAGMIVSNPKSKAD